MSLSFQIESGYTSWTSELSLKKSYEKVYAAASSWASVIVDSLDASSFCSSLLSVSSVEMPYVFIRSLNVVFMTSTGDILKLQRLHLSKRPSSSPHRVSFLASLNNWISLSVMLSGMLISPSFVGRQLCVKFNFVEYDEDMMLSM